MRMQKFAAGLALILAVMIPACGGGSSSSTPVTTTTTVPCVQTVIRNDTGTIPASTFASITFSFNTAARLDVIADWTNASSPIGVYVTSGSCTLDQFNARSCNFVI